MERIGIICEYNPFHNGHIYHLRKIKEQFPDSLVILVMSGNYTMRGEISILNKWDKTDIALSYGVDLVIELPTFYATNSADIFASGAIRLLNLLKCNYLIFGTESNDIKLLQDLANIQINNKDYDNKIKYYMDLGNNYPTSQSKALKDIYGKSINLPNDLLGLSYVKQIILQKTDIIPLTIQRTNDYHEIDINSNITSATSIRNALKQEIDISNTVPKESLDKIVTNDINQEYFKLLKYQIITNINILNTYLDVDEGLDNLIKKNIYKCQTLDELINKIKTKRYTYNRLNRMFIHILLNVKKDEVNLRKQINYIRVLGFNKQGRNYLKKVKKEIDIPIITNYSDLEDDNLTFELNSAFIYNEIVQNKDLDLIELKSIPIQK